MRKILYGLGPHYFSVHQLLNVLKYNHREIHAIIRLVHTKIVWTNSIQDLQNEFRKFHVSMRVFIREILLGIGANHHNCLI